MTKIDSRIPEGPVAEKWTNYKAHQKLVNPANKRRLDIIVVGTGLAGASAAASLGEMGFKVFNFCIQDSPRRAHSIAAQGGINAAKNYQNDGRSQRLPSGRGIEQHHRPVRGTGRSLRPRIRRYAGQPFIRWCTSITYLLRQRSDWTAVAAGCLLCTEPSGKCRYCKTLYPLRNGRRRYHRRSCPWYHRQEPGNR